MEFLLFPMNGVSNQPGAVHISNVTGAGEITTQANPEVVETIQHHVQAAKVEGGQLPREQSEQN